MWRTLRLGGSRERLGILEEKRLQAQSHTGVLAARLGIELVVRVRSRSRVSARVFVLACCCTSTRHINSAFASSYSLSAPAAGAGAGAGAEGSASLMEAATLRRDSASSRAYFSKYSACFWSTFTLRRCSPSCRLFNRRMQRRVLSGCSYSQNPNAMQNRN